MRYASVCSGIEAATMAWHPLGWEPAFFSEIEPFPSAVLAHHYGSNMPGKPLSKNGVPNLGDFTKITDEQIREFGPIDLLVGGTPCQSFSVAGKRLGLDDPRGNLALEYLRLARRLGARWIVWENVPGVLSSVSDEEDGEGGIQPGLEGRSAGDEWIEESDFATFLSFVRECGYGFAYRVLDAQYVRVDGFERAVPQRRRRVFVVGYLGDWRRAAAVLLEREGMRWDPAPRRESGKGTSANVAQCLVSSGRGVERTGDTRGQDNVVAEPVAPAVTRNPYGDHESREGLLVAFGGGNTSGPIDVSTALTALTALTAHGHRIDFEVETFVAECAGTLNAGGNVTGGNRQPRTTADTADTMLVAHSLRGEGFDASEDGTVRGTPIVPVAFDCKASGRNGFGVGEIAPTLRSMGRLNSHQNAGGQVAVAFDMRGRESGAQFEGPHETANIRAASGGSSRSYVAQEWAVRRLTPRECERLQGFPDDFTNVPWNRKQTAPDGPRYKALGNSMAVNCMSWIGQRIDLMEKLIASGKVPA